MQNIAPILEKYDNFRYAQIRSIKPISETSKELSIAVQDDDGEDIGTVKFTFKDIKQSRILEDGVLSFLDTGDGVSIIKEHGLYGFALGSGTAMLHVHSAPLYIVASELEVQE